MTDGELIGPRDWEPALGETFESFGQTGEVTELEPERVLEWTLGGDRFRFELEPDGDGCRLVFVHAFADRTLGPQYAAGWELYLDRLDVHLGGGSRSDEELLAAFPEVHAATPSVSASTRRSAAGPSRRRRSRRASPASSRAGAMSKVVLEMSVSLLATGSGRTLLRPMRSAPRSSRIKRRRKPSEKGAATMKLTTMTQVTVDGVMQGNGGASDEDRRNGFERGGWAMGMADSETMTLIEQTYQRADAFLFGRRTYELFAGYWGAEERARAAAEDQGNHPITDALNTKPKYLVSNTLTEPRWANTTVLSGDVAAAVGELKARPGGELQVHGSGALIRWLLDNDLVDELTLLVVPVVLGQGARLFPDAGPDIALDLVDSRADSRGVTIQVYRPIGRPRYAPAATGHDDN